MSSGRKAAKKEAERNIEKSKRDEARQNAIFAQIGPLAQMFLDFGIDPTAFLASPQGQALLAPLQQATAKNFEGARVSLADQMAGSGMSNAAPFGNLLSQEAGAQSQNVLAMISQALGLGQAGAGILTGQQQIFDPARSSALAVENLRTANQPRTTLNALIGAIGQAVSGSAIGGLGGKPGGCWIISAVYGKTDIRTKVLWAWMTNPVYGWETRSKLGKLVVRAYMKFGERVARHVERNTMLRDGFKRLFDWILVRRVLA